MSEAARALDADELGVLWSACQDGLRPETPQTVTQWAEEHRRLSSKGSAAPGKWYTSRTPYLREIMDALSALMPIERVVVKKGSQVGVTEVGLNLIGEIIDRRRVPVILLLPDLDTIGRTFVRQKLDPMLEETPRLLGKVSLKGKRAGGNSIFMKEFPGGSLRIVGAKSPSGLRSSIAAVLFADEVDGNPLSSGKEGDPLTLAERALRTYGDRGKIFEVSTPLLDGSSRITQDYEACDVRLNFFVPCPHCEAMQTLEHEHLEWPDGEPSQAQFRCVACDTLIPELHKTWMLAHGEWRIVDDDALEENGEGAASILRAPVGGDGASAVSPYILAALERAGIAPVLLEAVRRGAKSIGFHLPAYYSPEGWFSWAKCAELYERAKVDPDLLQVYDNTVAGRAHKKATDAPEAQRLYERRETYPFGIVPSPRALFLTAGVDVQKGRLEWEIVAWGRGKESWSVDIGVIPGSIIEPRVTRELDALLYRDVPCSDGSTLPIRVLGIDSGYDSENVYTWARRHLQPAYGAAGASCPAPRTVAVLKGRDTGLRLVWSSSRDDIGGKHRGVRIFQVSGFHAAAELYTWLRLYLPTDEELERGMLPPPGYCHFPQYELEYFKQLTADRFEIRTVHGRPKEVLVLPKGARNEMHDCRKYARAVAELFGLSRFNDHVWRQLEDARGVVQVEEQQSLPLYDKRGAVAAEAPREPLPPRPVAAGVPVVDRTLVDASTGWEIAFRAGDSR